MTDWLYLETARHQVTIAGQVTDAQTGAAIGRARVEIGFDDAPAAFQDWLTVHALQYGDRWEALAERPDRTRTATDGHYHFVDLPDGNYMLIASFPGTGTRYGTAQAQLTVSRDGEGNVAMARADIALPPTTLKGRVTDATTGAPVAMAEVRVAGSGERAFSDAQGEYLLSGLEAGMRTVLVSARGYPAASRAVLLEAAGTEQSLDVELLSPTWLAGCKLWLQADALDGMHDGDPVATWPDTSGHGYDLVQAEETQRPIYKASVANGLPAIRFDGVDDCLAHALEGDERWSGNWTLFIVVAAAALGQQRNSAVFSSATNPSSDEQESIFQIDVSGSNPGNYRVHTTSATNIGTVTTGWVLLEALLSGTHLRTYYNGSPGNSRELGSGEGNRYADYVLGVNWDGERFFSGDLAAILVYDQAFSEERRLEMEGWLADRFAIPLA